MKLSEELAWRGLIKDKTFNDDAWLDDPKTFYLGVDVGSADSLTVGNLAVFLLAKRLCRAGWKTILLVGGATSLIGDPDGKDKERELVSRETVEYNKVSIKGQVEHLFEGEQFTPVDNYDWFKDIGYLEFLRDVGKYYSMTELVQRDYVKERTGEQGSGLSYAEFSYSLIQGYDYLKLFEDYGVELQIGGSDQWGNMLSGVPLIRKKKGREVQAMSMPLVINKSTGQKFGKSEDGAIWLDPKKTTPTAFYQFWINVSDDSVEDFLKIYTDYDKNRVSEVLGDHTRNPSDRYGQRVLAHSVTALVHGQEEAGLAEEITDILIGRTKLEAANKRAIEAMKNEIPFAKFPTDTSLIDVLETIGLATSRSDARRLLDSKAIYINNAPFSEPLLKERDFIDGYLLLRRGKAFKDSALIELK